MRQLGWRVDHALHREARRQHQDVGLHLAPIGQERPALAPAAHRQGPHGAALSLQRRAQGVQHGDRIERPVLRGEHRSGRGHEARAQGLGRRTVQRLCHGVGLD